MRPRALPLLIAIPFALAACDGDGDGAQRSTDTGGPQARGPETTVSLDEFSIKPKKVVVSSGTTIGAKNVGATAHNLTIERGPAASKPSKELAATPTFPGGESDSLKVDLRPGRYALVCTVPGHREQGMVGSLTVR